MMRKTIILLRFMGMEMGSGKSFQSMVSLPPTPFLRERGEPKTYLRRQDVAAT